MAQLEFDLAVKPSRTKRPPRPRRIDPKLIDLKQLRRGITPAMRRRIFGDDDSAWCYYCGFPAVEVEHIIPVTRGGGLDDNNLVAVCWQCNHENRDLTPDEWAAKRRAEGKPWPIPSFTARTVFLLKWAGPPRWERPGRRWVIRNFDEYRRLYVEARDHDLTALLADSDLTALLADGGDRGT